MQNKLRMNTQYIDFYCQTNKITKEEFAKRCDITNKELNSIYNQKNIDIVLMIKIVEFLKITTDTFLFKEKHFPKRTFTTHN
ncbi:MAG: helix-turn-helix transcriptional regulator [Clostridia bacterium]|nr:helix-turn-helix transcriptional regulator [Clostridia bacterium]